MDRQKRGILVAVVVLLVLSLVQVTTMFTLTGKATATRGSVSLNYQFPTPSVVLIAPANNFTVETGEDNSTITFVCKAGHVTTLFNLSLYLSNSTRGSFAINQTTNTSAKNVSAFWTLVLERGNYTWSCQTSDNRTYPFAANRSLTIKSPNAAVEVVQGDGGGTTIIGGGGTRTFRTTIEKNATCPQETICFAWSECRIDGAQTRDCVLVHDDCSVTKFSEKKECRATPLERQVPGEIERRQVEQALEQIVEKGADFIQSKRTTAFTAAILLLAFIVFVIIKTSGHKEAATVATEVTKTKKKR
ncbi:hypothetical protein COV20_03405 [Candidatus Woesearchaeota archaeon CG10_big_fil_rev_8_21_14_0_10_45_16]|nr:MAG: hypothetical protein COV20_03405 [Candidatus Woesearchaeota archaeon CG10_big_fil_rev_8_21_14_0_10_45_16]